MPKPRRRRRRSGVFLVEVLGVMIAGAIVFSVTIAALVAALQADRHFARRIDARHSLDLLADTLRRDAHAAVSAAWDADARRLTLELPGGNVTAYVEVDGRWERRLRDAERDDDALAGAFRMPRGGASHMEVVETPDGVLVRFIWTSTAKPHDPTRGSALPVEVVAAVGRDLELLYP